MKSKLIILIVFLFVFAFKLQNSAYAADPNFDISVVSNYTVHDNGITTLLQNIQIKNKTDFYYTPSYTISVGFKDIENIEAYNQTGSIPTTLDDNNPNNKSIKLTFPKRIAGLGSVNSFTLKFDTKDVAKKQGSIWEVSIPGIEKPEDFSTYSISVVVPPDFGNLTISKPVNKPDSTGTISFTKDEIGKAGVYLLYGDSQYYTFNLTYNITNPNLFPVKTEIALPSDTNYQNVLISSFSIKPINVTKDADGNWIAEYRLMPQQKESIIVRGIAKVLPKPQSSPISVADIKNYTKPEKYWESTNPLIEKTAKSLHTPQQIYDFVVKTLTYNYSKINQNDLRLGGVGALDTPTNSVCLEFTDLFVTLARAVGIPARAVEGFAYTQNSKLRPLSLADDILHAWPEYYDTATKRWIMVDPTWGNTTRGMDYFSSLDFEHLAFVVNGVDSQYPIPAGGYKFSSKSKDVNVTFASSEDYKITKKLTISDTFPNSSFPGLSLQGSFIIRNDGNSAVSNLVAKVTTKNSTRQYTIDYIPPGGFKKLTLNYPEMPFLTNGKYVITIHVGDSTYSKIVAISLLPNLMLVLIIGGIISGSIIIAAVTYHTGSILIQRRKRQNSLRGKSKKS